MSRRVRLPGADELFRATTVDTHEQAAPDARPATTVEPAVREPGPVQPRGGSGRVKHDEKVTVYMTADELMALEQARLALRQTLTQKVDRGRIIREAVALAIADLEAQGGDSALARRLSGE